MRDTDTTPAPRCVFAAPGEDLWREAWYALSGKYHGDIEARDPASGECWQYMGTWRMPDATWVHQFRHRAYRGHERRNESFPATAPPA